MAINTGALAMAVFGFVVLFGGLAVTLYLAFKAGGYGQAPETETDEE